VDGRERDLSGDVGDVELVAFVLAPATSRSASPRPAAKNVNPDDVDSFIAIDGAGMVTVYSGKVELGTGAVTAIAALAWWGVL